MAAQWAALFGETAGLLKVKPCIARLSACLLLPCGSKGVPLSCPPKSSVSRYLGYPHYSPTLHYMSILYKYLAPIFHTGRCVLIYCYCTGILSGVAGELGSRHSHSRLTEVAKVAGNGHYLCRLHMEQLGIDQVCMASTNYVATSLACKRLTCKSSCCFYPVCLQRSILTGVVSSASVTLMRAYSPTIFCPNRVRKARVAPQPPISCAPHCPSYPIMAYATHFRYGGEGQVGQPCGPRASGFGAGAGAGGV